MKTTQKLRQSALTMLAIFAVTAVGCRSEKYKAYDAQQKAANQKKANEANKLEESKSFNIDIVEGLLPSGASNGQDYYTNMKDDDVKENFSKFNQLIESSPLEAAKYLTLATNPWATKLEVFSTSSGTKYLDKSLNLASPYIPGDLFKINGNKYHKLAFSLGINLVQAYALQSANFTNDANFKLLMAGLLFLKKAELEMQLYRDTINKSKSDPNDLNTSRFRTKKYLELGLITVKYALTGDESATSSLIYPVQFVNFGLPVSNGFVFDIFAKESNLSMEELVLNPQNGTNLLNGAFNNLGYIKKDLDSIGSLATENSEVALFEAPQVDVSKMTNQQILDTAIKFLNYYKIKDPEATKP